MMMMIIIIIIMVMIIMIIIIIIKILILIMMMMMMMMVTIISISIIIITIFIIIAFKGAVREFSQSLRCATNCLQQVRSSSQAAIVCKSRAKHRALITCNMSCATWYEGTAQLLSLTELKSNLL